MLSLDSFKLLFPLFNALLRAFHLLWLMIQDYQIPAHEIESIQFVAGLFGIYHILIDHESGAFRRIRSPSTNLADRSELCEKIEECWGVDVVAQILHEQDAVGFRSHSGAGHACTVLESGLGVRENGIVG
jgi:hypothetical protein